MIFSITFSFEEGKKLSSSRKCSSLIIEQILLKKEISDELLPGHSTQTVSYDLALIWIANAFV